MPRSFFISLYKYIGPSDKPVDAIMTIVTDNCDHERAKSEYDIPMRNKSPQSPRRLSVHY